MKTDNNAGYASASELPAGCNSKSVTVTLPSASTASGISTSALGKRVIVRDTSVGSIRVPYSVAKESERRQNLLANRGPEKSGSTNNE